MPVRPDPSVPVVPEREPTYLRVANELQRRIVDGELHVGAAPPSEKQVAAEFGVAVATAHRILNQLRAWRAIEMVGGRRQVVLPRPEPPPVEASSAGETVRMPEPHPGVFTRGVQQQDAEMALDRVLGASLDP